MAAPNQNKNSTPFTWKSALSTSVTALTTSFSKISNNKYLADATTNTEPDNDDKILELQTARTNILAKNAVITNLTTDFESKLNTATNTINRKNITIRTLENRITTLEDDDFDNKKEIKNLKAKLWSMEDERNNGIEAKIAASTAIINKKDATIRSLENRITILESLAKENLNNYDNLTKEKDAEILRLQNKIQNMKKTEDKNTRTIAIMKRDLSEYTIKIPHMMKLAKEYEFKSVVRIIIEGEELEKRNYARGICQELLLDIGYAINNRLGVDTSNMFCNGCGARGLDRFDMEYHLGHCQIDAAHLGPGLDGWVPRGMFSYFDKFYPEQNKALKVVVEKLGRRPRLALPQQQPPVLEEEAAEPPVLLALQPPVAEAAGADTPPVQVIDDNTSLTSSLESLNLLSDSSDDTTIAIDSADMIELPPNDTTSSDTTDDENDRKLPSSDTSSTTSSTPSSVPLDGGFGLAIVTKFDENDYKVEEIDNLFRAGQKGFGMKVLDVEFDVGFKDLLNFGIGVANARKSEKSTVVKVATPPHTTGGIVGQNGDNINLIRSIDGCLFAKIWRHVGVVAGFKERYVAKKYVLMMLGLCRKFGKNPKFGTYTTKETEEFIRDFCAENNMKFVKKK